MTYFILFRVLICYHQVVVDWWSSLVFLVLGLGVSGSHDKSHRWRKNGFDRLDLPFLCIPFRFGSLQVTLTGMRSFSMIFPGSEKSPWKRYPCSHPMVRRKSRIFPSEGKRTWKWIFQALRIRFVPSMLLTIFLRLRRFSKRWGSGSHSHLFKSVCSSGWSYVPRSCTRTLIPLSKPLS